MLFDANFRPKSYFRDLTPEQLVLSSISGEERRRAIKEQLEGRDPISISPPNADPALSSEDRDLQGRIHPALMGGEYLPTIAQNEIEIARIVFQSVTQDVISIRAAPRDSGISYRIVTEYDDIRDRGMDCHLSESDLPLTQGQLVELIHKSNETYRGEYNYKVQEGLIFSVLRANLENDSEPDDMRSFVEVVSEFYPGLGEYFHNAVERFVDDFVDAHGQFGGS